MRGIGGPTRLGQVRLRRRALIAGAAGLLLPLRPARAQRSPPLKVGVMLPASGPQAEISRSGAEIAAEMLARRGRPMTLRFASAGSADAADRAAARLTEDGADLLLSASGEGETAAMLAVCERRGVPLIACAANEPRLTDRGARMIVRTAPTTSQLLGRGLGLLRDLHHTAGLALPRRLALVYGEDDSGALLRTTLAAVLPAAGLPVQNLSEIAVADGTGAGGRLLARLREAAADVIMVEAAPGLAAACVAAIMADGVRPAGIVAFGFSGLASQDIVSLPHGAGEGHVTFSPWADPRSPVTAEARALYMRRSTAVPFAVAQGELALMVDSLLLASEAAARHPGARGPALAAALRGSVLAQKMLRGPPIRFDQRGQNTALPSVALQNRGGVPLVVLPREWAEAEPAWPNPALMKS
jgi:ABC-type branched-subunit amino acid transport system substrate-binding protein